MSTVLDWNSIGSQKGSGKSNDVIFLNAKNLPKVLLPSQEVIEYNCVYDGDKKRNRLPVDGDDNVRTQYLFYGLSITEDNKKVIKIYSCGKAVAQGIGEAIKIFRSAAKQFDENADPEKLTTFVKVTATGSGLSTVYKVETIKVIDKPVPTSKWDELKDEVAKLPKLEEMRDKLLGLGKEESSSETATAGKSSNTLDI
jgi:Sec-independent protein translocase protein TatA